jgi:hypothetical protein
MAIQLFDANGKQVEYSQIAFIEERMVFEISDTENKLFFEYIPKLYNDYADTDYSVYLFYNEYLSAENNIFQIYLKETCKRIGWIFPIQAILSKDHDYSENEHFLKYSFVAFSSLISSRYSQQQKIPGIKNEISLTDFYFDDTIILVLCNEKTNEIDQFNIDDYLCSFSNFGYYRAMGSPKAKRTIDAEITDYFNQFKTNKRLTIDKTSELYAKHFYINELYKSLLYNNDHHLVRFHLLYQVIELLIERTFEMEFDLVIESFQNNKISQFELKEKLNTTLNEKERIIKVFSRVQVAQNIADELHTVCNQILKEIESEKENLSLSLYRLRNNVVHGYRKLSQNSNVINKMHTLNFRFELFISELLRKYSE